MKVTLKTLNAKYNAYGYSVEKTEGAKGAKIYFEGVLVDCFYDSSYVWYSNICLDRMGWLNGQTCELPAVDVVSEGPTANIEATLDTAGETCKDKEVKQVSNEMKEVSFFSEVVAMNTRVSDADLDAFESQLQNELYPATPKATEATVEPLQELTEAVKEANGVHGVNWSETLVKLHWDVDGAYLGTISYLPQSKKWIAEGKKSGVIEPNIPLYETAKQAVDSLLRFTPATPLEIASAADEMSEALEELSGVYYFLRLTSYDPWVKVETRKFIVYRDDHNVGKLEYDPSFKTWKYCRCVDGYYTPSEGGYVSAKQVLDAMLNHSTVGF